MDREKESGHGMTINAEGVTQHPEFWEPHVHGEDGTESVAHIHVEGMDWSLSMGLPVSLNYGDEIDLISLMEFRGIVLNMANGIEEQRAVTDLTEVSPEMAQFTVLAYNVDRALCDALVNVVDQGLVANGVEPPCQLQTLDSSNLRSAGFVMLATDEDPEPTIGVLYVAFQNGGLYRYEGIPLHIAQGLSEDESPGAYFAKWIKGAPFTKVV